MMGVFAGARIRRGRQFILAATVSASVIVAGGFAFPEQAAAQSSTERRIEVDIPAQDLNSALLQFTQRADLQIVYTDEKVAGRRSSAVKGRFTPVEALSRLLVGTGLTFRFTGENRVTLEPAPQASGDGAIQLGPVRVEGATKLDATGLGSRAATMTEGTGSYTTRRMTTATKLGLAPRETPQSVSVVTREQLDNEGATTLVDALAHVPGVRAYDTDLGGPEYLIRGYALDTIQVNGAVARSPNGWGLAGRTGGAGRGFDMAIYDHVEILRGAAGLTQGSSEPGGTINLVNKLPTEIPQAIVQAEVGSWNHYRLEGDVSGPLSGDGRLRARLVGAFQDNDSFTDYVGNRKYVAYGVVQAELTPTTLLNAGAHWIRLEDKAGLTIGLPFYSDGSRIPLPRSTYFGVADYDSDSENTTAFVELEQQIGADWTVKFNATRLWTSWRNEFGGFWPNREIDPAIGTGRVWPKQFSSGDHNQTSLSVSIDGSFTLFGKKHELVFGGDYRRSRGEGIGGNLDFASLQVNIFDYDPANPPLSTGSGELVPKTDELDRLTNKGIFAVARIALSERLKLIVGSRLSWHNFRYDSEFWNISTSTQANAKLTPYGGITFDITPSTTLYASYSDIFVPQSAIDRNGGFLKPVIDVNYEVGIKKGFANDTLIATAALYRIDRTNDPLPDYDGPAPCPYTGSDFCSIAGGKRRSQGFEVELTGEFTRNWQGTLSYTLTNNKYLNGDDLDKKFNAQQPKHLVKFSTAVKLPGALSDWTIGGSAYYQSEIDLTSVAQPYYRQAPYALFDLMTRYRINDNFSISGNVNNIFDKNYYILSGSTRYANYFGEPRSFMVTLRGAF